ncbi:hypothetical protein B9Y60_10570 [Stenotrophomonas maltophilia]|uniref:hypothetical protein n=1 Tax=Stenotrophomonas maltophilia TaxID=40324 RepID=UPI000C25894C|nr:hypothetical protein [Stenotrophomonas maltophilia]PJL52198.1 hypothetical protein B9Y73_10570 [Stenotrophomonas maltophilia]PJL55119.1 hypothetical protein B9Y60_10570 [Stenotrophomonas maltophilia]
MKAEITTGFINRINAKGVAKEEHYVNVPTHLMKHIEGFEGITEGNNTRILHDSKEEAEVGQAWVEMKLATARYCAIFEKNILKNPAIKKKFLKGVRHGR